MLSCNRLTPGACQQLSFAKNTDLSNFIEKLIIYTI